MPSINTNNVDKLTAPVGTSTSHEISHPTTSNTYKEIVEQNLPEEDSLISLANQKREQEYKECIESYLEKLKSAQAINDTERADILKREIVMLALLLKVKKLYHLKVQMLKQQDIEKDRLEIGSEIQDPQTETIVLEILQAMEKEFKIESEMQDQ